MNEYSSVIQRIKFYFKFHEHVNLYRIKYKRKSNERRNKVACFVYLLLICINLNYWIYRYGKRNAIFFIFFVGSWGNNKLFYFLLFAFFTFHELYIVRWCCCEFFYYILFLLILILFIINRMLFDFKVFRFMMLLKLYCYVVFECLMPYALL